MKRSFEIHCAARGLSYFESKNYLSYGKSLIYSFFYYPSPSLSTPINFKLGI